MSSSEPSIRISILHQAAICHGYMEQNTRHMGTLAASHHQLTIRMCHVPDVTLIVQLL